MAKIFKRVDLKSISSPDFVKDLTYKELDVLSNDIRDYILDITSKNGGHLSANLGTIDATIALCRVFDFTKDKIIFDVGHQCYTYKLLTGRQLDSLRKKDGISGFQKMSESPYDHFEAGHSSTSISAASGMAIARDLKKEKYDIIAFIGDSSIQNGLAFEALNNLAQSNHKVIVVLNDNDMSISQPVGGLSKAFRRLSGSSFYIKSKSAFRKFFFLTRFGKWMWVKFTKVKNWFKRKVIGFNIFDTMGLDYIGPVDGHYIRHVEKALQRAKRSTRSVIVHIKTIKGKGYKYAEEDMEGLWHGVSKFDVKTGEISTKDAMVSWSEQYKFLLKNEMKCHENIVTVVPATGHGSDLDSLFKEFPSRMVDVGIAEEHAFTMAGGLASLGIHPVISIYSTFLQRSYDELSHDIARMNFNCTILIDRAGLVGSDGETHQGIYDEAFLYTIPNVTIAMASRSNEALSLMKESLCDHGVFAIRYPREYFSKQTEEVKKIPYGSWKAELESNSKEVVIVSVGPITVDLKNKLQELHKDVTLFNAIYVRPMDESKVLELLNYKKVIIYNAYATKEGFANALESKLVSLGYKGKVIVKTVPTEFVKQATINEQRELFGIKIDNVIDLL